MLKTYKVMNNFKVTSFNDLWFCVKLEMVSVSCFNTYKAFN